MDPAQTSLEFKECLELFLNAVPLTVPLLQIAYISQQDFSIESWFFTDADSVVRRRNSGSCTALIASFHAVAAGEAQSPLRRHRSVTPGYDSKVNGRLGGSAQEGRICYLIKADQSRTGLRQTELSRLLLPTATLVSAAIVGFQQSVKSWSHVSPYVFCRLRAKPQRTMKWRCEVVMEDSPRVLAEVEPKARAVAKHIVREISILMWNRTVVSATVVFVLDCAKRLRLLDIRSAVVESRISSPIGRVVIVPRHRPSPAPTPPPARPATARCPLSITELRLDSSQTNASMRRRSQAMRGLKSSSSSYSTLRLRAGDANPPRPMPSLERTSAAGMGCDGGFFVRNIKSATVHFRSPRPRYEVAERKRPQDEAESLVLAMKVPLHITLRKRGNLGRSVRLDRTRAKHDDQQIEERREAGTWTGEKRIDQPSLAQIIRQQQDMLSGCDRRNRRSHTGKIGENIVQRNRLRIKRMELSGSEIGLGPGLQKELAGLVVVRKNGLRRSKSHSGLSGSMATVAGYSTNVPRPAAREGGS